ncbi:MULTISPECIES: peptide deformylase [Brevibacterium]|uniref:Peptide deformylase n=1 Tax=Brevibacterium pityocampae TaxID=506594 RepID=A0ABP8JCL2_9MICO|nr:MULTISPECIES: peptide deformylase [Actinomycetes]MCK1802380.1 peptide deformylase [Brevibacterium sp. R8603A2]MCX0277498.1 peptide deformylase [Nocardia zapadnayensis]QCP05728.1 peptide deformylase [Brevibacterium sp. CS2]
MPERPIRRFGDPVLKTVTDPVTVFDRKLRELVRDLLDSTRMEGRAGVAATQIGSTRRVFAYHVEGELGYVVNPELVETGGEKREIGEGCLSVPGLWYPTPRWETAVVRGVDQDNQPVVVRGEGLMAQMLQHEVDHLDGLVYLDRLSPENRRAALKAVRESDWF